MEKYIYQPLTYTLEYLHANLHDIGLTIVVLTIIVKILLLPLNVKASVDGEKTQRILKRLKPEIDKIKAKFKGDKMAEAMATQELYKREKFSPMSGLLSILILFIQLPILFGLYHVFTVGIDKAFSPLAFNLFNINDKHIWMGVLSGITMYMLGKITLKKNVNTDMSEMQTAMANAMRIQMTYVFPIVMGVTGALFPSGIGIYFVVSNILGIGQYYVIERFKSKIIL